MLIDDMHAEFLIRKKRPNSKVKQVMIVKQLFLYFVFNKPWCGDQKSRTTENNIRWKKITSMTFSDTLTIYWLYQME